MVRFLSGEHASFVRAPHQPSLGCLCVCVWNSIRTPDNIMASQHLRDGSQMNVEGQRCVLTSCASPFSRPWNAHSRRPCHRGAVSSRRFSSLPGTPGSETCCAWAIKRSLATTVFWRLFIPKQHTECIQTHHLQVMRIKSHSDCCAMPCKRSNFEMPMLLLWSPCSPAQGLCTRFCWN
jgi:hypothetical protein